MDVDGSTSNVDSSKLYNARAILKNLQPDDPIPRWIQLTRQEDPIALEPKKIIKAKQLAALHSRYRTTPLYRFLKTMRGWPKLLEPTDDRYRAIQIIEAVCPQWRGKGGSFEKSYYKVGPPLCCIWSIACKAFLEKDCS